MLALFYLLFGRKLHVDDAHKDALAGLDEREQIKNPVLLHESVAKLKCSSSWASWPTARSA